jgi:hypothetical protein
MDSTDIWQIPNKNVGYIDYIMNDPGWSLLVPNSVEVVWYNVHHSDLSTLKLNYLSPKWMESISEHFNSILNYNEFLKN